MHILLSHLRKFLPNVFYCYYKFGEIYFKLGKLLFFQIGAKIITNRDNYYKPEQLLKIGAQQLLLICQVIHELMILLQQQMLMKMKNFHNPVDTDV